MKESNVGIASMIPAAPGWKVSISGKKEGQPIKKEHIVGAFATICGEDGRETLTPVVFNENCEGLTLQEIELELEASDFEIENTTLYCGTERAVETKRR